jgi:NifB/MoaA-like Fe-S oxidoreductase
MAPFLRDRSDALSAATGAAVDVVEVVNEYFGETCTIAGLLAGRDILATLGRGLAGDVVVLPAEALNGDGLFIDSLPLAELVSALAPATVIRGYEVTEALGEL